MASGPERRSRRGAPSAAPPAASLAELLLGEPPPRHGATRLLALPARLRSLPTHAAEGGGVVLVLDGTDTVAGARRRRAARDAADGLLGAAPGGHRRVALVAGPGPREQIAATGSATRLERSIRELPALGRGGLGPGLLAAARLAASASAGGRPSLLVVVCDGRGAGERTALGAARRIAELGLLALVIDDGADAQDPGRPGRLEELAAAMGATYVRLPGLDGEALAIAVRTGAAQLDEGAGPRRVAGRRGAPGAQW